MTFPSSTGSTQPRWYSASYRASRLGAAETDASPRSDPQIHPTRLGRSVLGGRAPIHATKRANGQDPESTSGRRGHQSAERDSEAGGNQRRRVELGLAQRTLASSDFT